MKLTTKLTLAAFVALFFAVSASTLLKVEKVVAQDKKEPAKTQKSDAQTPQLGKYNYVAQPNDSYTLMARKAAQTYGKKFNVKLTAAGILFAETNLTKAAGSPHLAVGQNVEFNEATVKDWADKAAKLTPAEQAAWNYYVQFVTSFDTSGVGQAR